MATGQARLAGRRRAAIVLLVLAGGCFSSRERFDRTLLSRLPESPAPAAAQYTVHCPDVLDIAIAIPGFRSGTRSVGPDGRIDLGASGRLRVDGLTTPAIAAAIAGTLRVPLAAVEVKVAEFNSQEIFVHGEVRAAKRAIPYRGPERAVDLLRRAGGFSNGAAPGDIQVVRAHIADGGSPEVYRVNLEAIVLKNDQRSNVVLEPFDQVYVGQSRRSFVTHTLMPPCLRPLLDALSGNRRHSEPEPTPAPSNDKLLPFPSLPLQTPPPPQTVPGRLPLATP